MLKNPNKPEQTGIKFVIPTGVEPVTHSLEGCCSIQLSYGTLFFAISRKNTLFYSFNQPAIGHGRKNRSFLEGSAEK